MELQGVGAEMKKAGGISGNPMLRLFGAIPVAVLIAVIYWRPFYDMRVVWNLPDSYYSHGILIPPICLFLLWCGRTQLRNARVVPCLWGYFFLAVAALMLLGGTYLGFAVIMQLSLPPMLAGLVLTLLGPAYFRAAWFPIAFLLFMIPIPPSLTQSIALDLKLFATFCAVSLTRLFMLPVIQEGSFVYFRDDSLLIGEVCGGLRSLISMLAIGALMAYFSKAKLWARWLTLLLSAPIAIIANVFRIFLLCVVGYYWDSKTAAGRFHDISGILMFVLAFLLFFSLEGLLRKYAPASKDREELS